MRLRLTMEPIKSRVPGMRCAAWLLLPPALLLFTACGDGNGPTDITDPPPTANQPPIAAFSASETDGPAPLEVTFDAGASMDPDGEIVSYAWEFGDGATGSGERVTHVYADPGYFVPRLTVTDDRGATDTEVDSAVIVTIAPGDGDGTISGVVWHDRAGGGVRGPSDPGVAGTVVFLDLDGTGARDPGDPFTVTDRDGRYEFPGIETARSYRVTQELGLGWTNTFAELATAGAAEPANTGAFQPSDQPSRIIGGTEAEEGEFPFMVALLRFGPTGQAFFTCGGTFIAARWVLTAAHCLEEEDEDGVREGLILPPSSFEVLVGTHSLTAGGERIPVTRIRVFPAFGAESFASDDVALLELDRSFMIPRIALHLPERPHFSEPGTMATAAGWGRTSRTGPISTSLQKVNMELISNNECQRMLDENVVDSTICAGLLGATETICRGDSGGPLMVPDQDDWIQVGVSSFGARTCQPPMAFARVSEFVQWIEEQVPAEPSMSVEVDWEEGNLAQVDFGNFR